MSEPLIIPVNNEPTTTFEVELENETYNFTIHWNETNQSWFLDIQGVENGISLNGISLVLGIDLLAPFAINRLGSMFITDNEDKYEPVDFDGFGSRFKLVYLTL